MMTWCMAHPWMTLLLAFSAIYFTYYILYNVCECVVNNQRMKQFELMINSNMYTKEEIATVFKKKDKIR